MIQTYFLPCSHQGTSSLTSIESIKWVVHFLFHHEHSNWITLIKDTNNHNRQQSLAASWFDPSLTTCLLSLWRICCFSHTAPFISAAPIGMIGGLWMMFLEAAVTHQKNNHPNWKAIIIRFCFFSRDWRRFCLEKGPLWRELKLLLICFWKSGCRRYPQVLAE